MIEKNQTGPAAVDADGKTTGSGDKGLFTEQFRVQDTRGNWMPWAVAGALVVIGILVLVFLVKPKPQTLPNPGVIPLDAYAASLSLSEVKLSQSTNFAGSKVTYIDGTIQNRGQKTIAGVTVQVVFANDVGEPPQRETLALSLIRMHEPYVDVQAVSADPVKPGESKEFRLILDDVTSNWNQQTPELRIVHVDAQ